ncbi:MAG TPA: PQQ-dependent sugar dehydrogenase [bacterium]|nr:PQQ-dependent sugar dehydrogenase [bacterium]
MKCRILALAILLLPGLWACGDASFPIHKIPNQGGAANPTPGPAVSPSPAPSLTPEPTPTPSADPIDYVESSPGTFRIGILDSGLIAPTRLKISPDGNLLFAAELAGKVWVYRKIGDQWLRQDAPFYDVGDLSGGLVEERGMTGLFFGADFDPDSSDPLHREVFLTYQRLDSGDGLYKNRITRVTLTLEDDDYLGSAPALIYQAPQPVPEGEFGSHQIQDGIGFTYEGAPHFLVAVSDGFVGEDALDESVEGRGKILLLQRDGGDPLGPRPFANPRIQAIGIRNPYSLNFLPETVDPRRRILGMENGNAEQDRLWLLELVDFDHANDAPVSLGYTGSDSDLGWTQIPDLNSLSTPSEEGVLTVVHPRTSPVCADLHPGGGPIPLPGANEVVFVATEFGDTRGTNDSGRDIVMGVIQNLDGQPALKEIAGNKLTRIIQRAPAAIGQVGNPLALAVDPANGDILFADIFTGVLYRASPQM